MITENPKTLNPTETMILSAMLTRTYRFGVNKVVRPGTETMRLVFEGGVRNGDFRRFIGYDTDMSQPLEWATLVVNFITENRVRLPQRQAICTSWEEVVAEVKRLVNEQCEEDKAELQGELDASSPLEFKQWYTGAVIVDGKVIDPWGPAISAPAMWWLDNMTLVGVWLVYQVCRNAAVDLVNENLTTWTSDTDSHDPRKAAKEAFVEGLTQLDKDIRAHLIEVTR